MNYYNTQKFQPFRTIFKQRSLILSLAIRDFKTQYVKSYLGVAWALIQPTIFFSVLYFIFTSGFRNFGSINDEFPFVLYLAIGMSSWLFFASLLNTGANVIRAYSYLVRNSRFSLEILAPMKALSNLFYHLFFLVVVFIISITSRIMPTIHTIQILYYMLALVVFMVGVSWLLSSIAVFVPDINKAIPLIVQIGFWGTPVFWNIQDFSPKVQFFLKLNPAFYIVNGYRESILYKKWFWESPELSIYFWSLCLILVIVGRFVFKRLRPHFAEVL